MSGVPDTIEVELLGEDDTSTKQKIFMSFGLLNLLANSVQSPDQIPAIGLDANLMASVIFTVLVPRNKSGKPKVDVDTWEQPGLSTAEARRLIDWAGEHLLDFFLDQIDSAKRLVEKRKAEMEAATTITPSLPSGSAT